MGDSSSTPEDVAGVGLAGNGSARRETNDREREAMEAESGLEWSREDEGARESVTEAAVADGGPPHTNRGNEDDSVNEEDEAEEDEAEER